MTPDDAAFAATCTPTISYTMFFAVKQNMAVVISNATSVATASIMSDFKLDIAEALRLAIANPSEDNILYAVRQNLK